MFLHYALLSCGIITYVRLRYQVYILLKIPVLKTSNIKGFYMPYGSCQFCKIKD